MLIERALLMDAATRQAKPLEGAALDITLAAWELALADIPTARLDRALKRAIRYRPNGFPLSTDQVLTAWQEDRYETPQLTPLPTAPMLPAPTGATATTPVVLKRLREWADDGRLVMSTHVERFQAACEIMRLRRGWADVQLLALLDTVAAGCDPLTLPALLAALQGDSDGA